MKQLLLRLSIVLAPLFGPYSALAEPVPVQSGEHPAFTRLVVLKKGTDWQVTQTGRRVILQFDGYDEGFDTSRIFDFIPRSRIGNVESTSGRLSLSLACDCVVSTFIDQGAFVVIDVAESAGALQTAAISPTTEEQPRPTSSPIGVNRQSAVPFLPLGTRTAQPANALRFPNAPAFSPTPTPVAPAVLNDAELQVFAAIEERLGAEVSTAKGRGVLDPVPGNSAAPVPQSETSQPEQQIEETPPETPSKPGSNLRITTSRDLPETFRDLTEIISESGIVCPPDNAFALAKWGNNQSFSMQMAEARQGLYGEFDRIDPKVAQRLAQAYLFFGFGAEAREILRLAPDKIEHADYLHLMAQVLDGEMPDNQAAFSQFRGCDGNAALWAILTLPDPPSGSLPSSDPALRQLNALPSHLRKVLAPMLSNVLLAYGDPEGAATALRSLNRLPTVLPPEAKMALAALALDEGDVKAGTEKLEDVVEQNAQQSPRALISLVAAKARSDQTIDPETTSLIEAYAREFKDDPLGPELAEAHIIALVATGAFAAAFDLHRANSDTLPRDNESWLNAYMVRKLAANADNVTFLERSFAQTPAQLAALPPEDLISLTKRILDLGFAAQAETMIAQSPAQPVRAQRQLLAAQISLAMGKPFKAIVDLQDVEGTQADGLRADAKRLIGQHDEAHQLYASADRMQDAAEAAWLSENWRDLTPPDAPVYGPMTRLDAAESSELPGTDGMLARGASMLAESADARAALQSLLQADDLQVSAPENE